MDSENGNKFQFYRNQYKMNNNYGYHHQAPADGHNKVFFGGGERSEENQVDNSGNLG